MCYHIYLKLAEVNILCMSNTIILHKPIYIFHPIIIFLLFVYSHGKEKYIFLTFMQKKTKVNLLFLGETGD